MILLRDLWQTIGMRVTEGDAGVAQACAERSRSMIGKVVFIDHLAAVGAVSTFFMLDKGDFQRGGCAVLYLNLAEGLSPHA